MIYIVLMKLETNRNRGPLALLYCSSCYVISCVVAYPSIHRAVIERDRGLRFECETKRIGMIPFGKR